MNEKKITIGRIVHYNTTEADRKTLRDNGCNESEKLPAIIVATWGGTTVNVKVIVDGPLPYLYKTSITESSAEGSWQWPEIAAVASPLEEKTA